VLALRRCFVMVDSLSLLAYPLCAFGSLSLSMGSRLIC